MFTENYFINPSDSIPWNNFFVEPFPTDLSSPGAGKVNLSLYFSFKELITKEKNDYEKSKLILANKAYYSADKTTSNVIFLALCNFLKNFEKPFKGCYLNIPKHQTIKKRRDFFPAYIEWNDPQYPCLNSRNDMICLSLTEKLFYDVYEYCFGCKWSNRYSTERFQLNFPFRCICGFTLYY